MHAYYLSNNAPVPKSVLDKLHVDTHNVSEDKLERQGLYRTGHPVEMSRQALGDEEFEKKVHMMGTEHIHDSEEIRYVLNGSAFFDIREGEEWIRLNLSPKDFVIVPAGMYHRLVLDAQTSITFATLVKDAAGVYTHSKLAFYPRGSDADHLPVRKAYLESIQAQD